MKLMAWMRYSARGLATRDEVVVLLLVATTTTARSVLLPTTS